MAPPSSAIPPSRSSFSGGSLLRGRALYVAPGLGKPSDPDDARLVSSLAELQGDSRFGGDLPVASRGEGPFFPLGDAIDHDDKVRDALLVLSPDPAVQRFRLLRVLAVSAPISFALYVYQDTAQVLRVVADARSVLNGPVFKEAEANPTLREATIARRDRIEARLGYEQARVGVELVTLLVALTCVIVGARRFRGFVVATGLAGTACSLFLAGTQCFGSAMIREWLFAAMGLVGAVSAYALWPSDSSVAKRLRSRLQLPALQGRLVEIPWLLGRRRFDRDDLVGTIAAMGFGLMLPFVLGFLGSAGISDSIRMVVFVFYCLGAMLGLLYFRPEQFKITPHWPRLLLVGVLGLGVMVTADLTSRHALATSVEIAQCRHPEDKRLQEFQTRSSNEAEKGRKESQSNLLAKFIAVLAAPLAEEMLYRGALQRLLRRVAGSRASVLGSATVFGLAHMVAYPTAFYQHFALGAALATVFEVTGATAVSVVASGLTHALWNLVLISAPS